jgi:hypothetical protein
VSASIVWGSFVIESKRGGNEIDDSYAHVLCVCELKIFSQDNIHRSIHVLDARVCHDEHHYRRPL